MPDLIATLITANAALARRHVEDIPSEKFCLQFPNIANHPLWHLGHLTMVRVHVAKALQQPAAIPEEFVAPFGRGSQVSPDPAKYPPLETVLAHFATAQDQAVRALTTAAAELLDAPHGRPHFEPLFSTRREFFSFLLTTHDGYHLGQLAAWRRAAGLPSVLG